ncbi:hypothetical protein [Arthrobacter sp. C152]
MMEINWEHIGPYVILPVMSLLGAWLVAKIQHKGRPENALIDQLQEELTRHAARISGLETEQNKAKRRELIRDNYINKLRDHINQGNPPPPPEWPEGLYD